MGKSAAGSKNHKRSGRRRRSRGDESSDSQEEGDNSAPPQNNASLKDLNFAQRRELQRQAAAEKRRAKQKCYLCGKAGHVRRECPGILDDGRGESKYTKSKGDPGSLHLKKKKSSQKSSQPSSLEPTEIIPYPPGFTKQQNTSEELFWYYDAGCDGVAAVLEYLRTGRQRGKKRTSRQEARMEFQNAMQTACSSSNYGGAIARSFLKMGRPWTATTDETPLTDEEENPGSSEDDQEVAPPAWWYVVGLGRDFLYHDHSLEMPRKLLQEARNANHETNHEGNNVVGFFADLDYTPKYTSRPGCDRDSQLRRLQCTCQAALEGQVPIQIRLLPDATSLDENSRQDTPYQQVIHDVQVILEQEIAAHPDRQLKVHLSCWSGRGDDLHRLLQRFSPHIWVGMDGSVGFAKASHLHECAFDVPLSQLVLESGAPTTIPANVVRAMGRNAFNYPGWIPHVAAAVAHYQSSSYRTVTAADVARAASTNTQRLYGLSHKDNDSNGGNEPTAAAQNQTDVSS